MREAEEKLFLNQCVRPRGVLHPTNFLDFFFSLFFFGKGGMFQHGELVYHDDMIIILINDAISNGMQNDIIITSSTRLLCARMVNFEWTNKIG